MFSLLFDSGFWYDLIFIAAAVLLMYFMIKFPQGRIYFFTFLSLAFIAVTVYCGVNLNTYLSAQGGIFGSLSGAFGLDKVEVVDNQTFELNNLSMTLQTDGSYALEVSVNKQLKLDSNKTYGIFVNDVPTNLVESESDHISSNYSYNFYDTNNELLCADTLSIKVAMYANSTLLHVSTSGGSEACKYWNNYFNKNSFKIKIDDVVYVGDGIVTGGEGDISNFVTVSYYLTTSSSKAYTTKIQPKGTTFEDIYYSYNPGMSLRWQSKDGGQVYTSDYVITTSLDVYGSQVYDFAFSNGVLTSYTGLACDSVTVPQYYAVDIYGDYVASSYTQGGIEVTAIGNSAFENANVKNINLSNGIKTIGQRAFAGSSLTEITIPACVTSIGSEAFAGCTSLQEAIIQFCPLTQIETNTFAGCTSLTGIVIPETVESIGDGALSGCTSLIQIEMQSYIAPALGNNALPAELGSIIVPENSGQHYKYAWPQFAAKIQEEI